MVFSECDEAFVRADTWIIDTELIPIDDRNDDCVIYFLRTCRRIEETLWMNACSNENSADWQVYKSGTLN